MVLPRCSPHNFCLPQKVLGTVSTVSEAGPTPSASLQEIKNYSDGILRRSVKLFSTKREENPNEIGEQD